MQHASEQSVPQEELDRFREKWKEEVRQKKTTGVSRAIEELSQPTIPDASAQPLAEPSTAQSISRHHNAAAAPSLRADSGLSTPISASTNRAVELYRSAVECEQQGRLDEALALYRRSFKLDAHVDKAYHRSLSGASLDSAPSDSRPINKSPPFEADVQPVHSSERHAKAPAGLLVSDSLEHMLATFEPRPITFLPEDERQPNPLKSLPDEIMVHILMEFAHRRDVTSIERFASVNLKARLLTADATIWRSICNLTYVPPQIPANRTVDQVASMYGANYRQTFVNHPRIRLDGVYIAVCHYVRPGLSENAWIAISHLITYHRYLRFFPNGEVISLLTNEEQPPAEVVQLLKPSLRTKGLQIGRWSLDDETRTVRIQDLLDPSRSICKYEFAMSLVLSSARRGRWNKLEMAVYESINLTTGEVQELPLKRERPFYFSKVRSYLTMI